MWLVPRLGSFYEQYPDIDIRLMARYGNEDLLRTGDVDIDLRHGTGKWPRVQAQKFLNEQIFPVCSPSLLKGSNLIEKPDDLKNHILLHDNKIIGWKEWLDDAGIKGVDYTRGPGFSHYYHVILSAMLGHGIALGRDPLVADALARNELVRPLDLSLSSGLGYYIVTNAAHTGESTVRLFTNWLMEETEKFEGSTRNLDRLAGTNSGNIVNG
jgi:LysR family glycine cleavage system transcriptional activator